MNDDDKYYNHTFIVALTLCAVFVKRKQCGQAVRALDL